MVKSIGLFILRVSLGLVFLSFGIGKFQNDYWARSMEAMVFFRSLPWSAALSVQLAGLIEVATGAALIAGLFTRFFAALACGQLVVILALLNFQEIRDIGLLGAALYLTLSKDSVFGIDRLLNRHK